MQQGRVSGEPGLDLGTTVVLEEPWVQPDQVIEHCTADISHAAFADPRHQVKAAESTHCQCQHQQQKQANGLVELVRGTGHETLVHQQADALPHGQGDCSGDHQRQQCKEHLPAIGANELPTQAQCATLVRGNGFGHGGDQNGEEAADYHSSAREERQWVAIAFRSNRPLEL
ncbi:hypothetical protein D3C81_1422510 [compost metagenome]